jgi:hypothetical protein
MSELDYSLVKYYFSASLNSISHLLSLIPYEDLTLDPVELPPRQKDTGYVRPPISKQHWVPAVLGTNLGPTRDNNIL